MAVVFKGFSSPIVGKTNVLFDVELVKQDLINHFNTRKGERVMDVEYGFIGWDLLFELDRPGNAQLLEADARNIVAQDPRLQLLSIQVQNVEYGYQIDLRLRYVQLDTVEDLSLVFDNRSQQRMAFVNAA
ncbi:base plate protein [Pectobacterium phage vB_PcaM_CBB]|uniref:Base plate protein n=1 Tax=Pectobacterium phage vB_PcaM_CBB TaxID=2772511 RepID=A0A1L2CUV0_9CAUD|nr:base plate protein [Pectobacterium phage vB_PcaM_CBB]AMM43803.1 base plate protein [Pectobacterium phage vB_PcaM_CBB]